MLPDFPEIKRKFRERISEYLRELTRQEPMLSQIREVRHFEGNRMSSMAEQGKVEETSYDKISAKFELKKEDIIAKGHLAIIENIQNMAEQMKEKQAKLFLNDIRGFAHKGGNIVDAKGEQFTYEKHLEMLEKMRIDFDDQGRPYLPMLVVSPEMGAKLRKKIPEWMSNPDFKKKFQELMQRKKKEWDDRESHRRLVE